MTGHTTHAAVVGGSIVRMAPAAVVRIVEDGDGAYLLLRFDKDGNGLTDTWHATVADAQRQASVEYEIAPADWIAEEN